MASPPSADFSFTAPFPALKQRRVSLALPASTPRVPWSFRDDTGIAGPSSAQQQQQQQQQPSSPTKEPKKGKIRKTEPQDPTTPLPEKKPRKKWSPEETQMLVEGCNRHGVGNWKTILSDPTLKFDNRSPVDLKDRFRTYFPDAYKKHYPNARTHLSSKVRSTLPDGSSLFEKTRSKRRRPFTEEEDRALKAGYEKHGTIWATIVKDPIFQEQNRRSTDLRDRFRNAFPELYQAAGYKPRNNTIKKKKDTFIEGSRIVAGRAATDDQLALSSSGTTGPVRGVRRRRAQTSQGILLRGGTKSVPQSTAPSEDEDSSAEDEMSSSITMPQTPLLAGNSSSTDVTKKSGGSGLDSHLLSPSSNIECSFPGIIDDDDMGMRLISLDPLPDPLVDYPALDGQNPASASSGRSGVDTPTHGHHTWPSPPPQSVSKDANGGGGSGTNPNGNSTTSNSNAHTHNTQGGPKIGQSAWKPQDWLSPNPRLDHSFTANANTNGNCTPGTGTPSSYFSPPSPFTTFNLAPLNPTHPLSPPSNTTTNPANATSPTSPNNTNNGNNNSLIGNLTTLTTLNLPMNNYINYYGSHQHHGVIERYDLWPPSSSALSLSSSFSAVNNSSAWSSALTGSGGVSGPGSLSAFSSSFGGDLSSEVSFGDTQSAFSDDGTNPGGVFGGDDGATYGTGAGMNYVGGPTSGTNANGGGGGWGANRAIHSDYAGDLIFGARGYGIGGGFGWFGSAYAPGGGAAGAIGSSTGTNNANANNDNNNTTGLGLVGVPKANSERIGRWRENSEGGADGSGGEVESEVVGDGKGSINPMQLHAPSGSNVDEIALAGINLNDVDVDEEMEEVIEDDAMDGTSSPGPDRSGSQAMSTEQEKQPPRGDGNGVKSGSVNASPGKGRRIPQGLAPLSPIHSHSHQQYPHTPTHAHHGQHHHHSLSLSLGSGGMTRSTTPGPNMGLNSGGNVYGGRFSLDDLDLVDLTQQQNLVDMNNLTPPATPMMQHATTQSKGMRRYSVFGVGLGAGGANPSAGLFLQNQSQAGQGQGGQQQGGRSVSVPPSEARNPNSGNSLGVPFGGGGGRTEVVERGRSTTIPSEGSVQGTPGVKRSLSSTVHHSHGHGHSLSLSTLPPLPPHAEIWRSSTPVAKTTPTPTSSNTATGTTASIFNNQFSTPPHSSTSTPSSGLLGFGGMNSTNTLPINAEYTNPDLPFLDLHYNFGHQQQGFGAMMVDSPSATTASNSSMATTAANIGLGMTQAEVEARQALDLAHPFYLHGHGHHTHHNTHANHDHPPHGHTLGQGFGFGTNSGNNNNSNASASGGVGELKALVGSMLNTPLSVTRQLSQISASRQSQQAQGHGHQRVQSQQVVNPKDLVLNASPVGSGSGGLRTENKRKRASWDGGMV